MKKALRETQTLRCSKIRTPPARYKHTHRNRQDRLQYTAPLASAQCNMLTFGSTKQCFIVWMDFANLTTPY